MATVNDFAFLINFIENRIGLFNNKDFFAKRPKNKTRDIPRPKDYVVIWLPRGYDEGTKKKKFDFLMSELEKIDLDPIPIGKRILLEIPKTDIARYIERRQPPKLNLEPFEVYQKRFEELKKLHEKLPIFGIDNRDQPDISKGVAYFNYFNQEETEKALKLFSENGFGVEKRGEGKNFNLTFLLLDPVDTTNLPFGRGKLNGRTIDIFQWIIKKIYRKVIESLPEGIVLGVSGRGVIDCGEPEIFQIKKELEEKFGIIMLIHMSAKKRSEFFILNTPEAMEVYQRFNGGITSCDLISILKNPEAETEIKEKYKPKTETMKKNEETKFLSPTVRAFLAQKRYSFKQGDKHYLQIDLKGQAEESEMIISALGGSLQEKQKVIELLIPVILQGFSTAVIKKSPKTGTSISLSIPGYVNTAPRKTKKRTATEKPAGATPAGTDAGNEPPVESKNEEYIQFLNEVGELITQLIVTTTASETLLELIKEFMSEDELQKLNLELYKKDPHKYLQRFVQLTKKS